MTINRGNAVASDHAPIEQILIQLCNLIQLDMKVTSVDHRALFDYLFRHLRYE